MSESFSASGLLSELSAMRGGNFEKYLAASLKRTEEMMRDCADETRLRWGQGQAQCLAQLLTEIEQSDDSLHELHTKNQPLPRNHRHEAFI